MAAMNFDDFGEDSQGGTLSGLLNWAGAILSVLLIAGLATWGWKLLVRDVTGVPVVRALEGPMRIAPDDPGGEAAEYQGLAVNRIAESRVDENMADRVVLAPTPTTLDATEDLTMAELAPAPVIEEPVEPAVEAMDQIGDPDGDVIVEIEAAPAFVEAEDAIFADVEDVKPGPSATDLAVAEALGLSPQPASFEVVADDGDLSTSPRPRVRPADRRTASISSVLSEVTGEIDATSIPAGTRLVQLGAYGSADVARTEWAGVMAEFGDYMVGKDRVVQEAQSGGRTFWRLRAMGFDDLADARRFCSVLVAEGANCIPVVQE